MIQSQLCLVSISCSLMLSPFHSHSHRTAAGALAFSFSLLQILYPEVFAKFLWHLIGSKVVSGQFLDPFPWKGNAGSDWST